MIKTKIRKVVSSTTAVVCLLLICAILSSCSSTVKLKFKNGVLVSDEHEYAYHPAPLAYKPVAYHTEEEYAICDHPIFGKIPYFSVAGTDGEWIYCETDDTLYHLSTVEVPTLAQMKSESALVSTTGNRQIALGTLDDKTVIERLTSAIISGEEVYDPLVPPKENYHVSFGSEIYPFLVYSVFYYEYENGARLIYDINSGLFFEAGDEIHDLIEGAFDKTPTETTADADSKNSPN